MRRLRAVRLIGAVIRVIRRVRQRRCGVCVARTGSAAVVLVVIITGVAVVVAGMRVRVTGGVCVRVAGLGVRVGRRSLDGAHAVVGVITHHRGVRRRGGDVSVASLILVVRRLRLLLVVADDGSFRVAVVVVAAVGHVDGLGVRGEVVGVVVLGQGLLSAIATAAKDAAEEAGRPGLLRRRLVGAAPHGGLVVVVGVLGVGHLHLGRRVGEALLALVVAAEGELDKDGKDVKEAAGMKHVSTGP